MIDRIGIIYQDAYARGFLEGLQSRLQCKAELVPPSTSAGRSRHMTKAQARKASNYFRNRREGSVDIVIRFTDADGKRWQDVKRDETSIFPDDAAELLVCGVAVENTEEWLASDPDYLARALEIQPADITNARDKSSVIKAAINRTLADGERVSDVVARLVQETPPHVFKRWLANEAFRDFYEGCRAIAQ